MFHAWITDEQLCNLLAIRMRRRTRVMILLAAFAGLRVHEIAKIRGDDVDPMARGGAFPPFRRAPVTPL